MSLHLAQHTMLKLYHIDSSHLPSAAHDAPAVADCNEIISRARCTLVNTVVMDNTRIRIFLRMLHWSLVRAQRFVVPATSVHSSMADPTIIIFCGGV